MKGTLLGAILPLWTFLETGRRGGQAGHCLDDGLCPRGAGSDQRLRRDGHLRRHLRRRRLRPLRGPRPRQLRHLLPRALLHVSGLRGAMHVMHVHCQGNEKIAAEKIAANL